MRTHVCTCLKQWNPLNTKLEGAMKNVQFIGIHVIRAIRNTRDVEGSIAAFMSTNVCVK